MKIKKMMSRNLFKKKFVRVREVNKKINMKTKNCKYLKLVNHQCIIILIIIIIIIRRMQSNLLVEKVQLQVEL
jgi:hypothetical protein